MPRFMMWSTKSREMLWDFLNLQCSEPNCKTVSRIEAKYAGVVSYLAVMSISQFEQQRLLSSNANDL